MSLVAARALRDPSRADLFILRMMKQRKRKDIYPRTHSQTITSTSPPSMVPLQSQYLGDCSRRIES
jgi:hypothetical protein